ncbi:MAG: hypothetical protein LBN00_03375 [Oscillospiraceae bacterium]|nr:hypothetical protein [Oscillospiraceae bacterium]
MDYNKAYNAIKHDRVKNLSKANVRVVIRALAALYLLNVYYRNEAYENVGNQIVNSQQSPTGYTGCEFDERLGSEIFAIQYIVNWNFIDDIAHNSGDISQRDKFTYIIKYADKYLTTYLEKQAADSEKQKQILTTSNEFIEFAKSGRHLTSNDIIGVSNEIGAWSLSQKLSVFTSFQEKCSQLINSREYEYYYSKNKHQTAQPITEHNIDSMVSSVGGYFLLRRVIEPRESTAYMLKCNREAVLNKNQLLFTQLAD